MVMDRDGWPFLRPADGKLDHRERWKIRLRRKNPGKNRRTGLAVEQRGRFHRPGPQRDRFAARRLPAFAAAVLHRLAIRRLVGRRASGLAGGLGGGLGDGLGRCLGPLLGAR